MRQILRNTLRTLARASRADRRGTILILALGVVGIISVAAVSYVTIVRLDRRSATITARTNAVRGQVDIVAGHIGDLLAADLFENKIVTPDVPVEAWPVMFGDGEYRDVPFLPDAALNTFRTSDPGQPVPAQARLGRIAPDQRYRVGPQDDAWLAPLDPVDNQNNPLTLNDTNFDRFTRWLQITNLRSAYEWDGDNWVRQDGRFVDLAQWLIQETDDYADPSINLVNWDGDNVTSPEGRLGPGDGLDQTVFDLQMNEMGERYTGDFLPVTTLITGDDEDDDRLDEGDFRMWADTDGDLRPDARWTVLDSLGNASGLNWVVAARIVDASALINVNSSIEFASDSPNNIGDGRTPADVDLYRLLRESDRFSGPSPHTFQVRANLVPAAFNAHINNDLAINEILDGAKRYDQSLAGLDFGYESFVVPPSPPTPNIWQQTIGLQREQRFAFSHMVGITPERPLVQGGRTLALREMVDLLAFHGTNDATVLSRLEQRFDRGALGQPGYLPGSPTARNIHGPLRSNENAITSRVFVSDTQRARPTNAAILDNNVRRLLTLYSGAGQVSPVPAVSVTEDTQTAERIFADIYSREKVRIDRPLNDDAIERSFEAFMWALGPLDTFDGVLFPNQAANPASDANGYGRDLFAGTEKGPANQPDPARFGYNNGGAPQRFERGQFPAFTAAALATNLRDAA